MYFDFNRIQHSCHNSFQILIFFIEIQNRYPSSIQRFGKRMMSKYLTLYFFSAAQRLNPDIQNTVFCSGLRGGDVDNFNFLWSLLVAATDSTERGIYMNAMGCTSNQERRTLCVLFYLYLEMKI